MEQFELRPMEEDHLDAILALAQAQGRNLHASEYERFLKLEGAHGFVVLREGRLVAAATAIRYFEHGVIGPILAADGSDAVGLALSLTNHLVETLQRAGVAHVEAHATQDEAKLLESLGFERLALTAVLERPPGETVEPSGESEPMHVRHWIDLGALDARVVGYGRKEFLAHLHVDFQEGARVVERQGDVAGYAFLRRARRGYHLGPIVTAEPEPETARALAQDALAVVGAGWPVVALVPEGAPLFAELEALGFRRVASLIHLRAGQPPAGEPTAATQWALGSRITG